MLTRKEEFELARSVYINKLLDMVETARKKEIPEMPDIPNIVAEINAAGETVLKKLNEDAKDDIAFNDPGLSGHYDGWLKDEQGFFKPHDALFDLITWTIYEGNQESL